jgi:hypothetical protein
MLTKDANAITGGLSNPSKMPGKAFGLPAAGEACPIGAKLALIPGTVCHGCYATKGMYSFGTVKAAQAKRFTLVREALAEPSARAKWIAAMSLLVGKQEYFRWHDSGDVFSAEYLSLIVEVVKATPATKHWLPTRELVTVRHWLRDNGPFPSNLTVRLSLPRIDATMADAAKLGAFYGLPTSTVTTGAPSCPAPKQGNACVDCRACWDSSVSNVSYHKH